MQEAGRVQGVLFVYRNAGEARFTPGETKTLEAMARFVAHGLRRATLAKDGFAEGEDRALFVADPTGVVRHADGPAQNLLMMALNPRLSPLTGWRGLDKAIPEVAELSRRLSATASGQVGHPPPVLRLPSPWGEFVLRAYWLGPTDGAEQTRHVAITIERRVPRAVALLRRIENLPLTSRGEAALPAAGAQPVRPGPGGRNGAGP